MAPATTTTTTTNKGEDANNADIHFLVNMLASCGELDLDVKALATTCGIAQQYNIYPKMRKILKKYGFTYDSNSKSVIKIDDDGSEGDGSVEAPKKVEKRKKATPTPKSRKKATTRPKSKKKRKNDNIIQEELLEQEERAVSTNQISATPQLKKSLVAEVTSKEEPEKDGVLDGPVMRMDMSPGFAEWSSSDDAEEEAEFA